MTSREQELVEVLRSTPWFMTALRAARELDARDWCMGAGALRDAVWDALERGGPGRLPRDIDLAYFDATNLDRSIDTEMEEWLHAVEPQLPWEVTNQAGVHLWYEEAFGYPVEPLLSIEDAVGSWPETATSVAVSLDSQDQISVVAPIGLADLFDMVVRRNPRRVSVRIYRARVDNKKYRERWPSVRVVSE